MKALIVIDHGSRREASNALLLELAQRVEGRLREAGKEEWRVLPAHMELASPSLEEAFSEALALGPEEVVIAPFFLGPGRHATEDIPAMARALAEAHPDLPVRVGPPLGAHPFLVDALIDRAGLG